jgi:hypothetical protein
LICIEFMMMKFESLADVLTIDESRAAFFRSSFYALPPCLPLYYFSATL